jgi:DNA-binding beta-propeller fold protein YncE
MTRHRLCFAPPSLAAVLAGLATVLAAPAWPTAAARVGQPRMRPAYVRVRKIQVPCNPFSAAVDQRRHVVWVSCLARISETRQRVVARVHGVSGSVAVDPRLGVLWAVDNANGTITEVSEATNRATHTIRCDCLAEGVAVDPGTRTLWVTEDPYVRVYSEVTRRLLHTIRLHVNRLQIPWTVTVDPRAGMAWVSIVPGGRQQTRTWVAQISESAHKVIHTYPDGSGTAITAADPARGIVWMAIGDGTNAGIIEVIKESTHRIVRTFDNMPVSANGIAIDSRTRTVLAAGTNNRFLEISEATGKILKTIKMSFFPTRPAVDQKTGNVYVPIAFRGFVAQFQVAPGRS